MRITVKVGLIFALVWVFIKMIFFWSGITGYNVVPSVMINILLLLSSIAIGLYLQKRKDPYAGNALRDIKNAMTAGVPYILVVCLFLYTYYNKIDTDFNKHQIAEAHIGIKKLIDSPEGLKEVRESNEEFEVMTKEEIYDSLKMGPEGFYNPKATTVVALLAMLLLAMLNSILITIVMRKVIFKTYNYPDEPNPELDQN